MNLQKDPRTGNYVLRFRDATGKRKQVSLGTSDQREAKRLAKDAGLDKVVHAAKAGLTHREALRRINPKSGVTFEKCLSEWRDWFAGKGRADKSLTLFNGYLSYFIRSNGLTGAILSEIDPSEVSRAIDQFVNPENEQAKISTRRVRLAALRSLFHYAQAKGYVDGNPAQLVSVNHRKMTQAQLIPKKRSAITRLEYDRVMYHTGEPFWRWFTALGYWTGMRCRDIATLEWRAFHDGMVEVATGKTGRIVRVPIRPELRRVIAEIPRADFRYCFPEQALRSRHPDGAAWISRSYSKVLEHAGVKGKSAHCLRHAFAQRLESEGVAVEGIAEAMGHGNTATTRGYL